MSDTILTTKPGKKYASIRKPRVYEALRRRGYSKTSAARISNAQARKHKSYTVDDLARVALKEHADPAVVAIVAGRIPELATLKGTPLAPGVTRLHGDLCNVHGRWGSCRAAGFGIGGPSKRVAPKQLPKAPKPKAGKRAARGGKRAAVAPKKPKEPKKTPAERAAAGAAAHAAQQAANRKQALEQMRDAPNPAALDALDALKQGKTVDPDMAKALASETGLVSIHADGTATLSPAGRHFLNALDRGAAGEAADALSSAQDRLAKQEARQAKPKKAGGGKRKVLKPRATSPARSSSPVKAIGGGGAGGGGKAPARKPEKQTAQIPQQLRDAAQILSDGGDLNQSDVDALVRNGLVRRHKDGTLVLTARGLTAISQKSFTVFKDSAGQWRWIARTTTAFEDRDNEIISTKALEQDVSRADSDGKYGPLRWWHMGHPNPLSADAPWGPGVDLGWCDFNAMSGKTLIESGTFKDEHIARAVAAKADDLELSPGFFHAVNEPDRQGVFTHIRRFERSLVPKWAGRASNRYTGLIVTGKTMDEKKIQALKDLGASDDVISTLLADVQQTEKAAEGDGVRYKDASPIKDFFVSLLRGEQVTTKEEDAPIAEAEAEVPAEAEQAPDPIAERLAALEAQIAALKADAPADTGEVVAEEDAFGDAPPDAATADDGSNDGGLTLSAEDLSAIGQVIASAIEPLVGALGITSKLEGHLGELKTMMGGYVKQKDDAEAQRAEQIAALKAEIDQQQAKLAELLGEQPRAGYRPSQADDNTLDQLQTAIKDNPGAVNGADFSDIVSQLFPGLAQR